MAIAITLKEHLSNCGAEYELIDHPRTDSTLESAEAAHIPGDRMVKAVLLGDEDSYLLAVIPATHRLELDRLCQLIERKLALMAEDEVVDVFGDCDSGSIPPVGAPYGVDTVVDVALLDKPELYFEAGDHGVLIHMDSNNFRTLMEDAPAYRMSYHL